MSVPKSRLLAKLEASIASARDPMQAACFSAERAALLARLGRFDEAVAELSALRAKPASAHSPSLAVWLCLADGMVEHFRNQSPSARDRIHRAYALAVAARLRPLIALGAAWLAHTDYVYDDLPGLARHVAEALQEAEPDHHAARARAALVAAQGYHWGGRADLAQPWYQRAHEHATAEGDDTTLSALLKNRAWISGNQARMASIFGSELFPVDATALRHAQMSAESSEHFDAHLGHTALRSLGPVMRAQLLVAQGQYEDALAALQQHLAVSRQEGSDYTQPVLHADIAWCQVNLGRPDAALASARDAEKSFVPDCEEEDRAAAHGRLRQVYIALKMNAEALVHEQEAHAQLQSLRAEQGRLVDLLNAALKHVK
jgi:predicted negative regulator of RcsB-dependent stress response